MRSKIRRNSIAWAVSAAATVLLVLPIPAQQAPSSTPRAVTRPASEVLARIGQSAGVVVLADSTIQARLPVPAGDATPETVESQIAEAVRALPAGTTWVKLYVPAPVSGRWSADLVEEYARALARQVGASGRPAPAGMVDVLGRPVPADRASEYAAALNLKLVYLVTNPQVPSAASASANWSRLTPEQRAQYAQQQAQRLLALDPASRVDALHQLMTRGPNQQEPVVLSADLMIFKTVMSQLTDNERVQLKQSFAGDKAAAEGRLPGGK